MKTIEIKTGRPYRALVGKGLLKEAGARIREKTAATRAMLITDDRVNALYGDAVRHSLAQAGFSASTFSFAPGEASKTMQTFANILEALAMEQLTRAEFIIALGGGVVGDIAGFAAATYLRGVDFIQIPTTLLAAVDASVGGKTGIDLAAGKNLAGAFWQPRLVLCDTDAFDTLPGDVFLDGVAESIKHGLICDADLFEKMAAGEARSNPVDIVARNIEIKAAIVEKDERDTGERQLLNLGHTIGHAIERVSGYKITHGHAVAMGMAAIARAAAKLSLLPEGEMEKMIAALAACGLPVSVPFAADALFEAALVDKKRSSDMITLVMPTRVGRCVLHPVKVSALRRIIALGVEEQP